MNQVYPVEVIISNKPQARDPEGEIIIRDLIHKRELQCVKEVRTGKVLMMQVEAASEEDARNLTLTMCNELRLFNPVAHSISIRVRQT